jgi:hypothetical protein
MPEILYAHKPLTSQYRSGWSHLERSEYVGAFKLLGNSFDNVIYSADGEHRTRLLSVVAPRGVKKRDAVKALEFELDYGCRCEHDCCGHWQARARAKKVKGRKYFVEISEYMNV